jgi:hypothetical protein
MVGMITALARTGGKYVWWLTLTRLGFPQVMEQGELMSGAGTILITGPAGAKQELLTYLTEQQPGMAARVAGVEPLDHPTDGELVAFARKFFKAADRMHSQFRQGMHQ